MKITTGRLEMMSKTKKFAEYNDDRAKKGLPPIPYKEWRKEQDQKETVSMSIEYLDLDRVGYNRGTNNKLELMKSVLYYTYGWETGSYKEWINKLSIRLGLAPRTVKENYLHPLIEEGIIVKDGSLLRFVGPPEKDNEE